MTTNPNTYTHIHDLQWLADYIRFCYEQEFTPERTITEPRGVPSFEIGGMYGELMQPFTHQERLLLTMALANTIYPQTWNVFAAAAEAHKKNINLQQLGFVQLPNHPHLQATISTALFLLGGKEASDQAPIWQLLLPQANLRRLGALDLPTTNALPPIDTVLKLSPRYQYQLLTQAPWQPQYGAEFPATLLTTGKTWDDLVVDERTEILLEQARKWVRHYDEVRQQPGMTEAKGYRLLMAGPSGTGKTLTAALLGQAAGKPLYRIDVSSIVDKYVGETSKRLRQVFDLAEQHDWILFFDEGDALFGKRSSGTGSSNERYANQEVAYLLYKLEEYQGMIFLATNHKGAIDAAFERRFDSLVTFSKPDESTRRRLWQHFFGQGSGLEIDPHISAGNWRELAEAAPVSAAWIEKFYQYCVMQTTAKHNRAISADDMRTYLHWFSAERGYFDGRAHGLFRRGGH